MNRVVLVVVSTLVGAAAAQAEVVIDLHDRPLVATVLGSRVGPPPTGGLVATEAKSNTPAAGQWFVPHYAADKLHDGDSTFFSIRNEGLVAASVAVEFFDVDFQLQTTQTYDLEPREVKSVAVRNVPNLTIGAGGYARGFLRMTSLAPILVDVFQLETRNAFAAGGVAFVTEDFCTRWNARFLRFGTSGGTTLSMMVNGPQGTRPFDPVTVAGDVYSESGDFVGSFSIRTDEWSFEVAIHDLVPTGVDFGVVELVVNSVFLPSGIVEVQHQALGQFSVGYWAACMD